MTVSLRAIYVISWSQTETDGIPAAPQAQLEIGALWRWSGTAVRVDGPAGLLFLDGAEGGADLRRRAARMVQRLIGVATGDAEALAAPAEDEDAGEDPGQHVAEEQPDARGQQPDDVEDEGQHCTHGAHPMPEAEVASQGYGGRCER